jgi:hypothetical protein
MVITGAFLAEAAASADSKLHVWGGVLATFTVGPTREFGAALVVITQQDLGTADPLVRVSISPPAIAADPEPVQLEYQVPDSVIHADVGFAYFPVQGVLPFDGRYTFVVRSGESSISLPLTVAGPQQHPPRHAR